MSRSLYKLINFKEMSDIQAKHGCWYLILGLDGDSKAWFFFIDIHLDTEVVLSSIVLSVKVELEDVTVLLLGGGHREDMPHLEELLDVLLGYGVLVRYLEAYGSAESNNMYDYWSCYQIP